MGFAYTRTGRDVTRGYMCGYSQESNVRERMTTRSGETKCNAARDEAAIQTKAWASRRGSNSLHVPESGVEEGWMLVWMITAG